MYDISKKGTWYGELRTPRGNTILIYDNQFPEAPAGRIYFYNTSRDVIIEYDEDIVKAHLHELNDAETQKIKQQYDNAWEAARAAFMEKHEGWVEANSPPKPPLKKTTGSDPDIETSTDLDDTPADYIDVELDPELDPDTLRNNFNNEWRNDDFDNS